MKQLDKLLAGDDLRSIGKSNPVVSKIQTQNNFDELFEYLFHKDRIVVMHAADSIEKITINDSRFLYKHKKKIIDICSTASNKELKWHLALLIPRLPLNSKEFGNARNLLTKWVQDKANSRIVRVNSIQGLYEMTKQEKSLKNDFRLILSELEKENIPSINARIKRIRKELRDE